MGGVEHISIHHTNEIAQSEAANGKKYVNYWLHNEHLLVDGRKMGKSEGNSYLLRDILDKGYDALDLRYFFLQAHYRSKQNFTWEALDGARIARNKLLNKLSEMHSEIKDIKNIREIKILEEWKKEFVEYLEDDFNIPQAVSLIWKLIKSESLNTIDKVETIFHFDAVLGLDLSEGVIKLRGMRDRIQDKVELLIAKRDELRKQGKYEESDKITKELKEKYNVELEDQKEKTEWRISL